MCVGLEKVVNGIQGSIPKVPWDFEEIHYFDNGPLTVQYLFVLDALNFCFWPGTLSKIINYFMGTNYLKICKVANEFSVCKEPANEKI